MKEKKSVSYTIRLPIKLKAALVEQAKKERQPLPRLIKIALAKYLGRDPYEFI